ncbi:hypothetical protein Tco_0570336 [Tanacetum coccineum]
MTIPSLNRSKQYLSLKLLDAKLKLCKSPSRGICAPLYDGSAASASGGCSGSNGDVAYDGQDSALEKGPGNAGEKFEEVDIGGMYLYRNDLKQTIINIIL